MKTFTDLPIEKKERVVNACLKTFGQNSYEKASIANIAKEANVSKSMIFHYFGSKKDLYLYLIRYSIGIFSSTFSEINPETISDYFERIHIISQAELTILRKHPHLFKFIMRFYYEKHEEVYDGILQIIQETQALGTLMTLEGIDRQKFKTHVDLEDLSQMIRWMAEGLSNQLVNYDETDLARMEIQLDKAMKLMKTCLYKEEYL